MDAVGRLYAEGPEPVRDRRAAAMWFRKAADAGDGDAMYRLGVLNAAPGGIYGDGANRAEAVRWYREAAAVGVPAGQYALGLEYFRGQALPKDDVAAFGLLKQAADKGYVPALAPLGLMYETGAGGAPRDAALALSLYRSAAEKNDPIGMVQLARRDWTGVGVARSPGETVRLLRQAATLGNPSAMVFLAQLELQGGVAKNDADALALFRKAAKQGDPVAMYDLGVMYRDGLGVGRDRAAALDNFERAADAGYTPAGKAEGALLAQQAKSGRR
jgi:TPR repeat protein